MALRDSLEVEFLEMWPYWSSVWPHWKKCVTGGMRYEVSEAQGRPSVRLSSSHLLIKMQSYQLLLQHHVCLHITVLPAMTIMDKTPEPVSQHQLVFPFIRVVMVMTSITSIKPQLRHICMCVCLPHISRYIQRPEEEIGFSGAEVTGSCELSSMGAGN